MKEKIEPREVCLDIIVPASKSVAIRSIAASILSLLRINDIDENAKTQVILSNFPLCDDTQAAINIATQLGFNLHFSQSDSLIIKKQVADFIASNPININCNESALCYRMFPFIVPHFRNNFLFNAEGSLLNRKNSNLLEFLNVFGICDNDLDANNSGINSSQILINRNIKPGKYEINCSHSSQELTGLLFSLPICDTDSVLIVNNLVSLGYIQLTLDLLNKFGIQVKFENDADKKIFYIKGNQKYEPIDITVEGDWSIASNFFVLGAIAGEVTLANLNINSLQPDKQIYSLFKELSIDCEEIANSIIRVRRSKYSGFEFNAVHCPDLIPALVVLAVNAQSSSKIYGIERLINKESDRRAVLQKVFSLLGAKIKTVNDYFEIYPSKLSGGFADSHNDHRIAMAIAIAARNAHNSTIITRTECVKKSFPNFWRYF